MDGHSANLLTHAVASLAEASLPLQPLAQSDIADGPAKSNEGRSFSSHAGLGEPGLAYLQDFCGLRRSAFLPELKALQALFSPFQARQVQVVPVYDC
jgi:hypothetical protein